MPIGYRSGYDFAERRRIDFFAVVLTLGFRFTAPLTRIALQVAALILFRSLVAWLRGRNGLA
jgi:hypothetical protein